MLLIGSINFTIGEAIKVPFSYLDRQFSDLDLYFNDLKAFVLSGDFTLGKELEKFENSVAELCKAKHAIGVASGTDALIISLKMLGIGLGDEVITTPMTFIATVGAIVAVGARPVFVDSEDGYVIDPDKIEKAITPNTKAIIPVHFTGNLADMPKIKALADQKDILVIEDACQAFGGSINNNPIGFFSNVACFSFHPLKNLNIWSDGGMIITNDSKLAEKIKLYRNHGLIDRDHVAIFGCNSRLDTLQAVIGNRLIKEMTFISNKRIANAEKYDQAFQSLSNFIQIPKRRLGVKHVFHLYIVRVKQRDSLLKFLQDSGIEAKIHYPIPLHLQTPLQELEYKKGDFPVCEKHCEEIITLPAHQHLTEKETDYVIQKVYEFYGIYPKNLQQEKQLKEARL